MDAKREAEIRARHAKADERYPSRDAAARDAHEDRGDLLAALDEARAQLRVLARVVTAAFDPHEPPVTRAEKEAAVAIARQTEASDNVEGT